jgi:PAS domain S-box-containing protein
VGEILTNALARKQADEALRESEARFRLMADAAPVLIWTSGPDKRCTFFNVPWLAFTGQPMEHELGDGWAQGVHPDDLSRCLQVYFQHFEARRPFEMEYRLRRHDGEYRWVLDRGVPRVTPQGEFAGYIGACIDVSAGKQAMQELRRSHEQQRELASRLLRAQEEERRRIAREMHDDWTQRLAVLSIDIAKLEKQFGGAEKALPLLRAVREQVVALSQDVHALSRQLHPSILDDLGLVEALRSECASLSRREGIVVDYRPERAPKSFPKDVALGIYRVAQEALRNLAKHAAVSEARVSLAGTSQEVVLRVEDRGVGFDPAAVHTRPGLGLSSMEERVRLIGGSLSITSAPKQGTVVVARVPLGSEP